MTAMAVESLGTTTHYEVWKRALGSTDIRPLGSGRVRFQDKSLAVATADRLNAAAPEQYNKAWAEWERERAQEPPTPKLYYYFVLTCKTERTWEQ